MTATPTPSSALQTVLALAAPALDSALARVWRHDGLAERYRDYLGTMHAVVRASVPLLEQAALRCAELGSADPSAGPLRVYLEQHAEEERGHDAWLLADLEAGWPDRPAPIGELPPMAAARLVGPQYYWIEHVHPVALLGYIAVLEGHAPDDQLAGRVAAVTGLPEAAFRTVRGHAALDGRHRLDLDHVLDHIPLTPVQLQAITVSALYTVREAAELFHGIARKPSHTLAHQHRTDPP